MDDLIRRQNVIDAINTACDGVISFDGYSVNEVASYFEDQILRVDAAQAKESCPPSQWIPVTERLPEARRSVILSTKNWTGEGCYWKTTEHHVIWKAYRWNATYWDDEVLAWMPLPEPYKEIKYESHRK